jgi:hypothetical protein
LTLASDAAGVAPNDPSNTDMVVDKVKALGFSIRPHFAGLYNKLVAGAGFEPATFGL